MGERDYAGREHVPDEATYGTAVPSRTDAGEAVACRKCGDSGYVPYTGPDIPGFPRERIVTECDHGLLASPLRAERELLSEALDLVPRIDDNDPMGPALVEWCRKVRAALASPDPTDGGTR